MHERLIILDFGSQTTQLIGRRVRELNMYCEIVPYNKFPHDATDVKGVILSGSPYSVYDESAFKIDLSQIRGKYPVLGICYGAQFIAYSSGGKVEPANSREYGRANLTSIDENDPLFKGIQSGSQIWMSHGDTITQLPDNFKIIASTNDVQNAAYHIEGENTWGVQFHPEVFHSTDGTKLLDNFLNICGCAKDWTPASFIESTVAELKEKLGDDKVILALSGGVDSSVTAVLLNKAIGKNLTCIFVDHGLLRKNEFENVLRDYEHLGLNVIGVNAKDKFYRELAGVTEPEKKRKIIGKGFIDVFDEEAYENNPMEFYVVCTDAMTGEPVYKRLDTATSENLEWMRASASMPVVSRAVEIDGRELLDGGIADSIPLEWFMSIGYDRNVVVLTRPASYVKEPLSMKHGMKLLLKKYPAVYEKLLMRHEMYNKTTEKIKEMQMNGEVFVIQPAHPLGIGKIEHDPEKMERVYQIGRLTMESQLAELKNFLKLM